MCVGGVGVVGGGGDVDVEVSDSSAELSSSSSPCGRLYHIPKAGGYGCLKA